MGEGVAMKRILLCLLTEDLAGAAIEYSLVASIVSLAVVAGAVTIGSSLNSILLEILGSISGPGS
jgi:Flp pilus assembly pilin Flp